MAGDFPNSPGVGHTDYPIGDWQSYWCHTCQSAFNTKHNHPFDPIPAPYLDPLQNNIYPTTWNPPISSGIYGMSNNGWICPRCSSSNSPSTSSCSCNDFNTGTMYKYLEVEEDMDNLIEGLHFDLSQEEIAVHLQERFSYHSNRADEYTAQMLAYDQVPEEVQAMSGGGPKEQMEKSVLRHRGTAEKFKFMSEHLVDGATYRLSDRDLHDIEMLSDNRYF